MTDSGVLGSSETIFICVHCGVSCPPSVRGVGGISCVSHVFNPSASFHSAPPLSKGGCGFFANAHNDKIVKVVLFNYICVGMNNFRFTKIVASVSPILAKETVLSKIINMVDAFTLTLSRGFDDNNKKYIDTLMKLDNSKTVILETK